MQIRPDPQDVVRGGVNRIGSTIDIHLPRRIGQALSNAFEGKLDINYDEEGYFIRVGWQRND